MPNEVVDIAGKIIGEKIFKLRVAKLTIQPSFQLIDEEGIVIDEVSAQAIHMFPGKFIDFKTLCERLEKDANEKREEVLKIATRPLW
jgi:hypothetical protein